MNAGTETCHGCKGAKRLNIEVHEAGTVQKLEVGCAYCDGRGVVPAGTKAAWDAFWCKCGNPSGDVTHERTSTDIYKCCDCGAVVQTG